MRDNRNEVPPSRMADGLQGVHCVFVTLGCVVGRWSNMVLFHQMITVTQDAISQMNHILEKNGDAAVRYELKGGGCGGIIAEWKSEPHYEPDAGAQTWPLTNGIFVMDEFTKNFIDGGTVNYDLTNFMPNFIVSVPGKGQCGCGSSFVME